MGCTAATQEAAHIQLDNQAIEAAALPLQSGTLSLLLHCVNHLSNRHTMHVTHLQQQHSSRKQQANSTSQHFNKPRAVR